MFKFINLVLIDNHLRKNKMQDQIEILCNYNITKHITLYNINFHKNY